MEKLSTKEKLLRAYREFWRTAAFSLGFSLMVGVYVVLCGFISELLNRGCSAENEPASPMFYLYVVIFAACFSFPSSFVCFSLLRLLKKLSTRSYDFASVILGLLAGAFALALFYSNGFKEPFDLKQCLKLDFPILPFSLSLSYFVYRAKKLRSWRDESDSTTL